MRVFTGVRLLTFCIVKSILYNIMEKIKSWHRLDNSGKIYPFNLKSNIQNLFRISAIMRDDIDPAVLQTALQNSIKRYPYFNVCLSRGIFWHYLEELD